jgi:hypothetical protein
MHEFRRIDGRRGFQTDEIMFQIGGNKFYNRKNEIPMKILELKRSGTGMIVEFCGILTRFPNQAQQQCNNRMGKGKQRRYVYHNLDPPHNQPRKILCLSQSLLHVNHPAIRAESLPVSQVANLPGYYGIPNKSRDPLLIAHNFSNVLSTMRD